jgi:hypothetical protein
MKITRFATTAAAAMILASCASTSSEPTDEPSAGTNRPTAEQTTAAPDPEPTTAPPSELAFGQTATFDDGLQVSVSAPDDYAFEYADDPTMDGGLPAYLIWTVTVVNGTTAPYDPTMFLASVQSDNIEATDVSWMLDYASTSILPGREGTFTVAFGVNNAADLVMQVTPGFEYEPVFFKTGA